MILVGHNYGHGVNGVFLQLGRLKIGQQVEVVNATGQIFSYRVTELTSVSWTKKDQEQLLKHQDYLSVDGAERLTLVTCGGSNWAPFPNRVYVVADPAR
jgi:LPXTG-site transpeptidase (sortase) family protein